MLVDILLILALLGFAGAGFKDGFIQTLGRLVGAVLGFIAAKMWYASVATFFAIFMPSGWANVVGFIVIFLIITRLAGLAFKLVDGVFKILSFIPFLKSINDLLGAVLGLIEGFVLIGGAIYLIVTFKFVASLATALVASGVAMWILHTFQVVLGILL